MAKKPTTSETKPDNSSASPEKPIRSPIAKNGDEIASSNPAITAKPKKVDYSELEEFIWNGPVSSAELTEKESAKVVFSSALHPGKSYHMPVNHDLVISWKTSGLITPV